MIRSSRIARLAGAGAVAAAVVLVAGGCAELRDTATLTAPTAREAGLEVLRQVEEDRFPTPSAPVLLHRTDRRTAALEAGASDGAPPADLALVDDDVATEPPPVFTFPDLEGEDGEGAPAGPAGDGDTAAAPRPESDDAAVASDEETSERSQGDDGGGASSETTVAPDDDEPVEAPLFGILAAVDGGLPAYDDPSDVFVTAGGRPLELFGTVSGTSRGVTDTTITVHGLAAQTLVGAPHRVAACQGAAGRFAQANANGEASRRFEFGQCFDDAGDSNASAVLADAAVSVDAFAIVPLATPAFFAEARAADQRVLYVGDERLPAFCGRDTLLGFGTHGAAGCPVLDARGYVTLVEPVLSALVEAIELSSRDAVAYAVTNSRAGEVTGASRSFEAELLGLAAPFVLPVLPTAASGSPWSWQPVVDAIVETGAATAVIEGPIVDGLPGALRAAGFAGDLILVGRYDPLELAETARSEVAPLTVVTPGFDLASRSSDGWDAIVAAAAAVGVDPGGIGLDFVEGYLAADFLVRAVVATPEPLTVEAVADRVNSGWWYPGVDGVACGGWWPASHFITTPCVSISRISAFSPVPLPVLGLVETAPQLRFDLD